MNNRSLINIQIWNFIFFGTFFWSLYHPKDLFTWFLEVIPAIVVYIILVLTHKKINLTRLAYVLILIHCTILMVGGHYTYAEVPLFDWIKEFFGQERNNYDKLGHFAQGFVPALIAREILVRYKVLNKMAWLNFVVICFCLSVSAFYELVEWWVSIFTGGQGDAFLGTQGYVWDTQSDMFFALIGACVSLLALKRIHDRQLAQLI